MENNKISDLFKTYKQVFFDKVNKITKESIKDSIFSEKDVQILLDDLGRKKNDKKISEFFEKTKIEINSSDEYFIKFYDFLVDQKNEIENQKLYEKVKYDPLAAKFFEQVKTYLGGKINNSKSLYCCDYANQLFRVRSFVLANKKPASIHESLQEYHDRRTFENGLNFYKHMKDDLLKYNKNLQSTKEGKNIRNTANEITQNIKELSNQNPKKIDKEKITSLYNSMMIFIYGNNTKYFLNFKKTNIEN